MSTERPREARPKVREVGLVVERVDDELLVYDLERDKAHRLNETAALVFRHCDGERTVRELAAWAGAEVGRPLEEEVVWRALVRLGDEHLLEEPLSPPEGREWSRRQVLRRAGVAGAAAGLALPVVKSIVAPTSAQAQLSCLPAGVSCGVPGACVPVIPCCPGSFCTLTASDTGEDICVCMVE